MAAMSTDTLSIAHNLAHAGFTRDQAEGAASAVHKLVHDGVAAKTDIIHLGTKTQPVDSGPGSLEAKIEAIDSNLDLLITRMETAEERIEIFAARTEAAIANAKRQVILAVVAVSGAIVRLLKLLP